MQTNDDTILITLAEAVRHPLLPRRKGNKAMHKSTLNRWATNGINGKKLRTVKFGGARCTTVAWLYDFIVDDQAVALPTPAPRTHRQRRAIRAEREVKKILGLPPVNGGDQK
tara:strand:- start:945 stop:1280 length:336 start_codon:yes stop_codon:yes gene_type:complete